MKNAALKIALTCVVAAALSSGCGKTVDISAPDSTSTSASPGGPQSLDCGADRMVSWRFVQPQPNLNTAVDLLFVVDTSTSLSAERSRIASTVPAFINALAPGTDLRVGVMAAHGGASAYSGRLYSAAGSPKVLKLGELSAAQIQSHLSSTLALRLADSDQADGEALLYSLSRGLEADRAAEMRALGFLRDHAALSVVLISDENDICYRPELNGFTAFPDYVRSGGDIEVTAYNRYCSGITPATTLSKLKAFKQGEPVLSAAIAHVDRARVRRVSEDSIGHGLLHLVRGGLDGVEMDISDTSYSSGIAKLGTVVRSSLTLKTVFSLNSADGIRRESVRARVDGRLVEAAFDPSAATVQIRGSDAGQAGSVVDIEACR